MSEKEKENITGTVLRQVILKYIPQEFLKDVDLLKLGFDDWVVLSDGGIGLVQKMMDKAADDIRMFGTAKELTNDLLAFRNFTSSHRFFRVDSTEQCTTESVAYYNRKGEEYICKQDLFVEIQNKFMQLLLHSLQGAQQTSRTMVTIFLRTCENRLNGSCDFVKFDSMILKEFLNCLEKRTEASHKTISSIPEAIKEWKEILPDWTDEEFEPILKYLQTICIQYPESEFSSNYNANFAISKHVIKRLREKIASRPDLFLPFNEITIKKSPITVRIFDNCYQKYVMRSELFAAMNLLNPDKKAWRYVDPDGLYLMMDVEKMQSHFKDYIKGIEFITTTIKQTKHMEIPIMTSSGDYCITSVGALRFITHRLTAVLKIFQKIKKDEWNVVEEFLRIIAKELAVDTKCRYSISMKKVEKLEEKMNEHFKKYEKIRVKSVRDVRKVGFNLHFLKKEMRDLGLTEVLSNVEEYADFAVYGLDPNTNTKRLKTCDLFSTIECCQHHALKERFPELGNFDHYQGRCERFLKKYCSECSKLNLSSVSIGVQLDEYKSCDVEWNNEEYHLICSNGRRLYSNLSYPGMPKGSVNTDSFKFIILDDNDLGWIKRTSEMTPDCHSLIQNFDFIIKFYPMKQMYLRAFPMIPSKMEGSDETRRVFAEDVLYIIARFIKQDYLQCDFVRARLFGFQEKWKRAKAELSTTIGLDELSDVFDVFDIDKNLITIVPDPHFELSHYKMIHDAGCPTMTVYNSNGILVMSPSQAIFHIFQSIVIYLGFSKENCTKHENCKEEFRNEIIKAMNEYEEMDGYIIASHVEQTIEKLTSYCNYNIRTEFKMIEPEKMIDVMNKCVQLFFGPMYQNLSKVVENELKFKMKSLEEFLRMTESTVIQKEEPSKFSIIEQAKRGGADLIMKLVKDLETQRFDMAKDIKEKDEKIHELQKRVTDLSNIEKLCEKLKSKVSIHSENETKWRKTNKKLSDTRNELNEKVKELESLLKNENQKNRSLELETAKQRTNLQTAQQKNEKLQKQLEKETAEKKRQIEGLIKSEEKKTKEMEKIQKEYTEKYEYLEKKNTEERDHWEMESLEKTREIEKISGELEMEKTENGRLQQEILQKSKRINELECQMKENKKKSQEAVKGAMKQLQYLVTEDLGGEEVDLVEEILEKERIIHELRQTNIHLSGQIEQQNMTMKGIFSHFGQIKQEFSSAETQTETPGAEIGYTGTRHSLLRLQKIKDTFWNGNQIKTAKEMMQKLISMSNRCEIHQFANYELQQFETNIHNYVQEVERNIQKMKRTNDPMEMTSLPQPPSLSDRFMNEYWSEIDKERNKIEDSSGILTDSECLICFEEMKKEEKTLKCNECNKIVHLKCASQWLSVHRSCPHCRRELLDPNEFPALS